MLSMLLIPRAGASPARTLYEARPPPSRVRAGLAPALVELLLTTKAYFLKWMPDDNGDHDDQ